METLYNVVQEILALGPSVLMPVVIFLLAIAFRLSASKAVRSGLLVGIGFVGINLVIGLLGDSLGGAAQAMVERVGVDLSVFDVGWPVAATIAWSVAESALVIPLVLAANALLLVLRLTRTMNIDIWNYWHFAFIGMIAKAVTDSLVIGLSTAVVLSIVHLLIADWVAPKFEDYFELPGVTCTTGSSVIFAPISWVLDKIWERVPGIRSINLNPEVMQRRIGIFGDPLMIGVVLGALIALIAGYGPSDIAILAITMGAVMLLLPRMVAILMEGLTPISEAARKMLSRWFGKDKVYIGMDAALALGNTANLATAALLIPITVLLAFVLPGNRVLPFVDLASMAYFTVFAILFSRGNVFRGILNGTVFMIISLYLSTWAAPIVTEVAVAAGYEMPAGVDEIVSLGTGAHWFDILMVQAMEVSVVVLPIVFVVVLALMFVQRRKWVTAPAEDDDLSVV